MYTRSTNQLPTYFFSALTPTYDATYSTFHWPFSLCLHCPPTHYYITYCSPLTKTSTIRPTYVCTKMHAEHCLLHFISSLSPTPKCPKQPRAINMWKMPQKYPSFQQTQESRPVWPALSPKAQRQDRRAALHTCQHGVIWEPYGMRGQAKASLLGLLAKIKV